TTELKELFQKHELKPYSINSIEHVTFREAPAYEKILRECEELSGIAQAISCPYIVVVPGLLPEGTGRAAVIDETVRVLDELSCIAEAFNVSLAFEFLGQPRCSVQTLELADEIVRKTGRANVGLVIDSFHFYAGGSTVEAIEALDPDRLFIFHINDAEDRPREELQDSHRLLPGLGILPLKEIVAALRHINYDRVTSVEIFRPEYWEQNPFELAREAHRAASRVIHNS
ncbi:MAG: sugar phosphate isomerase/epimerase, partial [Acidobacteria bacterium]|nr:sugar phosphate isomerase/epimerase [Acidobacteriota bacterium]